MTLSEAAQQFDPEKHEAIVAPSGCLAEFNCDGSLIWSTGPCAGANVTITKDSLCSTAWTLKPKKRVMEGWINIYPKSGAMWGVYPTKASAMASASSNPVIQHYFKEEY